MARSNRNTDEQSTQQERTEAQGSLTSQPALAATSEREAGEGRHDGLAGASDGDDIVALRKRALASEARYRALIDSALDAVVGMDAQGHITEFNLAAERLFGHTRADALGQSLAGLIIPTEYRDQHARSVARYVETEVSAILGRSLRMRGLRSDGAEFPIELTVRRLQLEDDASPQFIGVIRDLTALRREEEQRDQALAEAESARVATMRQALELETTFEAMTDGVLVLDRNGQIIHSNSAVDKLFGYRREPDLMRLSINERMRRAQARDRSGRPLALEELPQMRALRGESLTGANAVDLRISTFHGAEIEVSCSVAPLRDTSGAITGAVAVYRDITERVRLERDLMERARELEAVNARLRAMLHVLPVGVFIADANGAFTEVNAMGRAIWGADAPMLTSLDEYGTYVGWWPETGEPIKPEEWALARALTTGAYTTGEKLRIQAFDGHVRTVLNSTAPIFDASGAIVGGVVTLMDITERERLTDRTRQALDGFLEITQSLIGDRNDGDERQPEAERAIARRLAELTRNVLACGRVVISVVEGESQVLRAVTIVGLEPEQERQWFREQESRSPQKLPDTLPHDVVARLLAGEPTALDATKPPYNRQPNNYDVTTVLIVPMFMRGRLVGLLVLDYVDRDKDGRNAPHDFTREEIQLAEAAARLGAVVLERERLLREREVTRAHALALEEANRRMDEFIGIAGHELRTPLTTVKANIQLAERRARGLADLVEGNSKASEAFARLMRLLGNAASGMDRQERLVGDLLDISRISSGKLRYRMAPCDLNALAREIAQEMRLTAADRVIDVDGPNERVMTLADADRVGQVLTNYLTNALKYSPGDRPVFVRLRRDGAMARVEVTDEGPGLSPEQQRNLFERFYRAEGIEVQSGSGVGLGLGLYICRMIVKRHGGRVGVTSAPGEGSTFWFALPLLPQPV